MTTPHEVTEAEIHEAVRRALDEDVRDGDVTTECTIPETATLDGRFVAKSAGVVAGLAVARAAFHLVDPRVALDCKVADGDAVEVGQVIATIHGPGRAILTGERVALNFLQRMSGIATATRRYVDAVAGTKARVLDTRKTVPGLRVFDKWAVRLGGGTNHRVGLYDMVMIKDNHIAGVGGDIAEAVARVRQLDARRRPIEVEVASLAELRQALPLKVDRIMLDNMSPALMREAVALTAGATPLEASGNVTIHNIREVAETGVDFISTGALTHSVVAMDISLKLDPLKLN